MKHFPAHRFHPHIGGIEGWHRVSSFQPESLLRCRRSTAWLAIACAFAAGFTTAIWTIGMIVTSR
ncbi:MAG: hypothetical protein HZA93_13120 [Verrucomicrobia bacterium]|nr:hypothetical protein [Verrucomicrobiota bacterium]